MFAQIRGVDLDGLEIGGRGRDARGLVAVFPRILATVEKLA